MPDIKQSALGDEALAAAVTDLTFLEVQALLAFLIKSSRLAAARASTPALRRAVDFAVDRVEPPSEHVLSVVTESLGECNE